LHRTCHGALRDPQLARWPFYSTVTLMIISRTGVPGARPTWTSTRCSLVPSGGVHGHGERVRPAVGEAPAVAAGRRLGRLLRVGHDEEGRVDLGVGLPGIGAGGVSRDDDGKWSPTFASIMRILRKHAAIARRPRPACAPQKLRIDHGGGASRRARGSPMSCARRLVMTSPIPVAWIGAASWPRPLERPKKACPACRRGSQAGVHDRDAHALEGGGLVTVPFGRLYLMAFEPKLMRICAKSRPGPRPPWEGLWALQPRSGRLVAHRASAVHGVQALSVLVHDAYGYSKNRLFLKLTMRQ
jgi:hypothetical protein